SSSQVSFAVPYAVASRETTMLRLCASTCSPVLTLRVAPSRPSLFTIPPPAAAPYLGASAVAFNGDGPPNSMLNPAGPGSTIALFITGAGLPARPVPDGMPGVVGEGAPKLPVRVSVGGLNGEVLYAGSFAGVTNGAVEIDVRLPQLDVPET